MKQLARIILLLWVLIIAVACRQQTLSIENINMDVTVTDSLVGETTLVITVTDSDGNAIENPGKLSIRGDMDHAGMTPVLRDAEESTDGVFTVPFEWTMGGAWTVEVKLTLENGEVATETFSYEILTEADEDMGDMDMDDDDDADDMDHSNMDMDATEEADHDMSDMDATEEADHNMGDMDMDDDDDADDMDHSNMDMGGETSAVYMSITNNGEETVTVISVETDVAGLVELHETTIENDVARMSPLESLVIEAGETVELRPAGKHIMLMQLTQDIVADEEIELSLNLESGDTIAVSALVQDMLMDDLEATVEVDDLVISNVWARPASAGMAMDDMDSEDDDAMDMESEDSD